MPRNKVVVPLAQSARLAMAALIVVISGELAGEGALRPDAIYTPGSTPLFGRGMLADPNPGTVPDPDPDPGKDDPNSCI